MGTQQKEIVKLKELLNKKDLDDNVRKSIEKRIKALNNQETTLK